MHSKYFIYFKSTISMELHGDMELNIQNSGLRYVPQVFHSWQKSVIKLTPQPKQIIYLIILNQIIFNAGLNVVISIFSLNFFLILYFIRPGFNRASEKVQGCEGDQKYLLGHGNFFNLPKNFGYNGSFKISYLYKFL